MIPAVIILANPSCAPAADVLGQVHRYLSVEDCGLCVTGYPGCPHQQPSESGREYVSLERASAIPIYDQNKEAWDDVLRILNLRTCYHPAIAVVLSEGRWRTARNPRGYVATAAARQALRMKLLDFSDREFRRGTVSEGRPCERDIARGRPDIVENASESGGFYERTPRGAWRYVDDYGSDKREMSTWRMRILTMERTRLPHCARTPVKPHLEQRRRAFPQSTKPNR